MTDVLVDPVTGKTSRTKVVDVAEGDPRVLADRLG